LILASGTDPEGKQTNVDAKFIHKEYDSVGTEAHKKRLQEDICKISNAPNMSDEKFSSCNPARL
jgi:SPP1 family phage portal protein